LVCATPLKAIGPQLLGEIEKATKKSLPPGSAIVMVVGELCIVIPFNVAFTYRETFPSALPAEKSTGSAEVELSFPRELVRSHEYVATPAHGPLEHVRTGQKS
jgi:hypothetical protein